MAAGWEQVVLRGLRAPHPERYRSACQERWARRPLLLLRRTRCWVPRRRWSARSFDASFVSLFSSPPTRTTSSWRRGGAYQTFEIARICRLESIVYEVSTDGRRRPHRQWMVRFGRIESEPRGWPGVSSECTGSSSEPNFARRYPSRWRCLTRPPQRSLRPNEARLRYLTVGRSRIRLLHPRPRKEEVRR